MRREGLLLMALLCALLSAAQNKWNRNVQVKTCLVDVNADMFVATTKVELELYNSDTMEVEGLYLFELRPNQLVTNLQLELNGKFRDGSIEEKWKANRAFNEIVGKRVDPALLSMDWDHRYRLQVYPIPAKGSRRITFTVRELLEARADLLIYELPFNVIGLVDYFEVNIHAATTARPQMHAGMFKDRLFNTKNDAYTFNFRKQSVRLNESLTFAIPAPGNAFKCAKENGQQRFAVRFHTERSREEIFHPQSLTVFWDASASGEMREIKKEINFLEDYISYNQIKQVSIVRFNERLIDTTIFETSQLHKLSHFLKNIQYQGATQIGIIDTRHTLSDAIFIVSDGYQTYGSGTPVAGKRPIFLLQSNPSVYMYDRRSTAYSQVSKGLRNAIELSGGKVINLSEMATGHALSSASMIVNWLMSVESGNTSIKIDQSLPSSIPKIMLVSGTTTGAIDTILVHYGHGGQVKFTQRIAVGSYVNCTEKEQPDFSFLSEFDKRINHMSWIDLIDFGLKHRVITPYTSFIVLERVEDYIKYNITPPQELEEACREMNYVKRNTRSDREILASMDEYDAITKVVDDYNKKSKQVWPSASPIVFNRLDYDASTKGTVLTVPGQPVVQTLSGRASGISITSSGAMDEVVVTGVGYASKRTVTGSITTVSASNAFIGFNTIESALQGRVAGLQVVPNGSPGAMADIRIRGLGSIGSSNPLYIVDGIPVSGNINDVVNVNDISYVSVLKDASSTALYGSRAANGVIIVNTRKGNTGYQRSSRYKLENMEDVEYIQELKEVPVRVKWDTYQQLIKDYGEEYGFYIDVAQHFFESNLRKEAFDVLLTGLEKSNGSQEMSFAAAFTFETWGELKRAELVYRGILQKDSMSIQGWRSLAWVMYQQGNVQEAVNMLYRAITKKQVDIYENGSAKSMLLFDMNMMINRHKDSLNLTGIPPQLIKPVNAPLRIIVDGNSRYISSVKITEPGGIVVDQYASHSKAVGAIMKSNNYYSSTAADYFAREIKHGKYKVSVPYYDYGYHYNGKNPAMIRIRTIKDVGEKQLKVDIQTVIIDNQYGEIEVAAIQY